jgi:hypothetical protein
MEIQGQPGHERKVFKISTQWREAESGDTHLSPAMVGSLKWSRLVRKKVRFSNGPDQKELESWIK